jgi:hypothetical protein
MEMYLGGFQHASPSIRNLGGLGYSKTIYLFLAVAVTDGSRTSN